VKETIGICVLNWNAGSVLLCCVRQLQAARRGLRSHLVVVDNASSDDSVASLRGEIPGLAIIQNNANLGYAAGNNVGARYLLELGCEILLFVNPDVTLPAESLTSLVETLAADPSAGCAGGVPLTPLGVAKAAARRRPSTIQKIVAYGPLKRVPLLGQTCRGHWIFAADLNDGARVYSVMGPCLVFRADAFRQIGGLDENTFLYEEEFIIAERLRACGWGVVVSTAAPYFHQGGLSASKMPYECQLQFYKSESYFLRHYYEWSAVSCLLLRLYRYVEWCVYSVRWRIMRSSVYVDTPGRLHRM
jgi:N-acetylglucosaminyl-diphospho-decaprenol L-rhamnosyltransferase